FVERGGGLVITDQTAAQDNWGRPRREPLLRFFSKLPQPPANLMEARGKGRISYARIASPETFVAGSLPQNCRELAKAVIDVMGEPTLRTDAPRYVSAECVRQSGRLLINLLDYSQQDLATPLHLWLLPSVGKPRTARLASPYHAA